MLQASHSVTIARPPGEVFKFLADGENETQWRAGVLDLKHESGLAVGAVYRQGVKGPGGRRVAADFEWTTYEPNSALAFRTIAGPVRPQGRFELEPSGEDTRLTFALQAEVTGLKRLLMSRMVARTMQTEVHNIENVKRILEGESHATG